MEQVGRSTSSGGGLRSRGSTVDTGTSVPFIERISVPFTMIDSFGAKCGTMRSGDADAV
jgi:hypothetical protein